MGLRAAGLWVTIPLTVLALPVLVGTALAEPAIGPTLRTQPPPQNAYQAPVTYRAPAPATASPAAPDGWGLRASLGGRWTDIGAQGLQWAADPTVPSSDVQAGVEWRHGGAAAVLGYGQYNQGASAQRVLEDRVIAHQTSKQFTSPGVLGLSFVLRTH